MSANRVASLVSLCLLVVATAAPRAQQPSGDSMWRYIGHGPDISPNSGGVAQLERAASAPRAAAARVRSYGRFAASDAFIVGALWWAPEESPTARPMPMTIPLPDGGVERIEVLESSIYSPEL